MGGQGGVSRPIVEAVKVAIGSGHRYLDLAEAYETTDSVGVAIRESSVPREELFIVDKVGPGLVAKDIRGAVTKSLEQLGTSYIDL